MAFPPSLFAICPQVVVAVEFELVVLLEVELRWTCQLDHDDGLMSVGIYDDVRPLQSRDYMGRKN